MRIKEACAILLILVAFASILSLALSSQTNSVVIPNTAEISTGSITAKSGSPNDIQAAVNAMASAGGGNVIIPAGNFTFNITAYGKMGVDNAICGVEIPGGVNVIGAGNNQTILYCPINCWNSTDWGVVVYNRMFTLDGQNGEPIRISGIYFEGSVNMVAGDAQCDNNPALSAIAAFGVRDYRIDHCTFINFDNAAIGISDNYVLGNTPNNMTGNGWNLGVIDHCQIDNPYKKVYLNITGYAPLWAYGIVVTAYSANPWNPDYTQYFGKFTNNTCYIEDCTITECRHCVAASGNGFYVLRFCTLTDMILAGYGSYSDTHGTSEGVEAYNNTFINTPCDYRSYPQSSGDWGLYLGVGSGPRGGFALIYNNTYENFQNGHAITLLNDGGGGYAERTHGVWIWNNVYINCTSNPDVYADQSVYNITLGVDYFLRAPDQAADGFTYTPYTYPNPLTLGQ